MYNANINVGFYKRERIRKGMKDKSKLKQEHCEMGTYAHQIPMPINKRVCGIDYCIADIVAALNAANINTVASCCGHGKMLSSICLQDGRVCIITENDNGMWKELIKITKGDT